MSERLLPARESLAWIVCFLSVATLIVGFIMYYIIPKFKKIFEDFGTKLPAMTEWLIFMSDMVVKYFYLAPAIPFAFYLLIKLIRKNRTGGFIVDWIALRIPLMGKIIEKTIVARTARTLGTLIASGVPILEVPWASSLEDAEALVAAGAPRTYLAEAAVEWARARRADPEAAEALAKRGSAVVTAIGD